MSTATITHWESLLCTHVVLLLRLSHAEVPLHIASSRAWGAVAKDLIALGEQLRMALLRIEGVLALQGGEIALVHSRKSILNIMMR